MAELFESTTRGEARVSKQKGWPILHPVLMTFFELQPGRIQLDEEKTKQCHSNNQLMTNLPTGNPE